MTVREDVALSELTTLRVGGSARYVLTLSSPEEIPAALAFTRERGLPFVVLGQGSNVLAPDSGYPGVVLLMRIPGLLWSEAENHTRASVGAGVPWDEFVRAAASRALWGVENLAGIPGTVGAAPVQNIGAYGAEVHTIIESVTVYDAQNGEARTIPRDECGFSYRDSRFKHEPHLIITSVAFTLAPDGSPRTDYADLIAARAAGKDLSTPGAIGETVREVRAAKFPDLRAYGTAGSFFKNPILTQEAYDALSLRYRTEIAPYGSIPLYPVPGRVKIPLAFILDKLLGMRGFRLGPTFLFGNQPLVLVADAHASAADVDALARNIEQKVYDATGISIEREVRDLTFHEYRDENAKHES
ncbi:MAG: UDP-N-acetylenolpyruvoylglucosamine reductase [Parcubacteria group bacterium]|nr:UDP-N-acetylenolpyruvoylglucosamine reductase [Parcubacteria group bacterium]